MKKLVFGILILLLVSTTAVSAQEPNRAALVIVLENGEAVTRCVEFEEEEILGFELLARSELALETSIESTGTTVCSVEGVGCPPNDCFCACQGGGECVYWSYWHLQENQWHYSQAGAGSYRVRDGAVEGWTWGPGTPQNAPEPPLLTFDDICLPTEPTATAIATTAPTAVVPVIPTPETTNPAITAATPENNPNQWLGYALLGLIVIGLGGVLATKKLRD